MSQQAKRFRPVKPSHMRARLNARDFDAERAEVMRSQRVRIAK